MKRNRPDKDGTHRGAFEKNKKKIYATQTVCGICGKPVDFSLKYPHPLSPCIDHIIPIAKGGHPSDLDNMQLAHWTCNRQKSDKLIDSRGGGKQEESIFTFQYVSINTVRLLCVRLCLFFLYIPICFYSYHSQPGLLLQV